MFGSRSAALGGIAGAVVGSAVALALVFGGALDGRVTKVPGADASADFLVAYQRSLEGTYVVQADFTRRLDSGATLTSSALVAQRPPDVIRRQFGGISGTISGKIVSCTTEDDGTFFCSPVADAPPFEDTVRTSVETMTSYFTGTPPLYRAVRYGSDCFELIQNRPSAVLPYGSQARFCFDEATGAVKVLIERLEGAIDTFEATEIRGAVSPQDFSLARDDAFAARTERSATDDTTAPDDTTVPDDTTPASDPFASSTTTSTTVGGTATTAAAAPGATPSEPSLPHTL